MIITAGLLTLNLLAAQSVAQLADKGAPAKASIAPKDEPGERLVVSGRVFAADGKTPLSDASIYVYQTDKTGIYSRPVNDSRTPRLRGYLRSDAEGRYEYTTIKPGSYPNTQNPAHIHYVVNAPGFKERIFEIVFEDDPLVDTRIRANAATADSGFSIRPLTRDAQGVLRCTQDIQLRK
jgi:protocatechuate 3,4-dioxygenase beta subunit